MTRSVWLFLALTFGLAWGLWVPLVWSGITVAAGDLWPSHLPGLLAPAVAAIVVTALTEGRAGLRRLAASVARWPLTGAMAVPVNLLVVLTFACVLVPFLQRPAPPLDALLTYSGAPAAGVMVVLYVFVVNGLGEELGWRGYLAENLLPRIGVGRTVLVTWLVWAAWHAPLFLVVATFRDFGTLGSIGWFVGIGFGTLVLTWLYIASGRSVLVTATWHTLYNFATATAAATVLSSGLATGLVLAVCVGLVRHRSFWNHPEN